MKYFLIVCEYSFFKNNKTKRNIVISESPIVFLERQLRKHTDNIGNFVLESFYEIIPDEYDMLKKFNPTNEDYIVLKNEDCSLIIEDSDDETEDDDFIDGDDYHDNDDDGDERR